jgi:hypothetical protein
MQFWRPLLWLGGFSLGVILSLWTLLRMKADFCEACLATTTRAAEKQLRLKQGRRHTATKPVFLDSIDLPTLPLFRGVGALLWKNLVAARRSKREMLFSLGFSLIYTGFITALLCIFNDFARKAGGAPAAEAKGFTTGIALFIAGLIFFLQRMFPFDFRRDGLHIVGFRTLPVSPLSIALAEISVPTALCLASQALGIIPLIFLGHFDWPTLLFVLLGFPAVALALNAVWNLYYLLDATKKAAGDRSSASAVGAVMVVSLSFLVFFPAGWTMVKVANHFVSSSQFALIIAGACGLTIQYAVDALLLCMLAKMFNDFEVARDFQ